MQFSGSVVQQFAKRCLTCAKAINPPDSTYNAELKPPLQQIVNPDSDPVLDRRVNAETHIYLNFNVD